MPPSVLRLWIISSVGSVRQAVVSQRFGKGEREIQAPLMHGFIVVDFAASFTN
jgi:hypothetical protein